MDTIPSFQKDHNTLQTGLYISTVQQKITTFDLRMKKPNGGDYISPKALHTIEHIIATLLRNGEYRENIIYFGPMGCRTGFYLLTVGMTFETVLEELKRVFAAGAQADSIPGATQKECGNYLEHDLKTARQECVDYLYILNTIQKD